MASRRLPLFPLPVVLLPDAHLPLHIFELRYRKLIADCAAQRTPFGILYHDPDEHGPFLFEEGRTGTEAHLEARQTLPDGRSLILVKGGARFRIVGEVPDPTEPYYEASVEDFQDDRSALSGDALVERRQRSIDLFRSAVAASAGSSDDPPELDSKRETSFPLADHLRIDADWLQRLLELRSEVQRLDRLDAVFSAASQRKRGT
jgi:Lon protease-like protein